MNRRNFLKSASAMSAMGMVGLSGAMSEMAHAAGNGEYKALVCIFLEGGMDAADTVLPYDTPSYDQLAALRPALFQAYRNHGGASAREHFNLLPLSPENAGDFGTREFALAPDLAPLKSIFDAGNAAIIGSVGPLIAPATRELFETGQVQRPKRLFSHNDQRSTWMALSPEGAQYGWGGRFADITKNADIGANERFAAIGIDGHNVFLSGQSTRPFTAPATGDLGFDYLNKKSYLSSGRNSDAARQVLKEHFASLNETTDSPFVQDLTQYHQDAVDKVDEFGPAIAEAPALTTPFPQTKMGERLRAVAQSISARNRLNAGRQVFFVKRGGFDTHSEQTTTLPGLQKELADAVSAFYAAMVEMGLENQVTAFTGSDFGRTTTDNGDGTDHGWAGHHFVIGGAVNGNRIYGELPEYQIDGQRFVGDRGRLIPSVSIEQYGATLGKWFGLSENQLDRVFPNLVNFSERNLGFV